MSGFCLRLSNRYIAACIGICLAAPMVAVTADIAMAHKIAVIPARGEAAAPAPAGTSYALLFLDNRRPVVVRITSWQDGKPARLIWESAFNKLFEFLDRDNDGILTKEEAERAPGAAQIEQQLRNAFAQFNANSTAKVAELDVDPTDGIVTREELAAYYTRSGVGALMLAQGRGEGASTPLTNTLFKLLDLNIDDKLSRGELSAAENLIGKFDFDDNEQLQPQELLSPVAANQYAQSRPTAITRDSSAIREFMLRIGDAPIPNLAVRLLEKYDKDKNQTLSEKEFGIDAADFTKLDLNNDGQLSGEELTRADEIAASFEVTFHLGKSGPQSTVQIRLLDASRDSRGQSARPANQNGSIISLDDAQLSFQAFSVDRSSENQQLRYFFTQQFNLADKDKNGYLDRAEAASRENPVFEGMFNLADRDGDGKMTLVEMNQFLDLQQQFNDSSLVLGISSRGRGLFELLDTNHDGQLGLRELRSAFAQLSAWDRNHDGLIALAEVPMQFQLTLSRGLPSQRGFAMSYESAPTSGSSAGPLWFRKMDRNGDGDISPREFVGSRADFERIDRNGDGLIDVQEAEQADQWMRRKAN